MARPSVYPQDFRDRAVNLVIEATPEHTSQWAAIETIGRQLGVSGETLRKWVRRAEVNAGLSTDQLEELKRLRRDGLGRLGSHLLRHTAVISSGLLPLRDVSVAA
jgi:transposase-like protein